MLLLSGKVLVALGVRGVCGKAPDYSKRPRLLMRESPARAAGKNYTACNLIRLPSCL